MSDQPIEAPEPFTVKGQVHEPAMHVQLEFPGIDVHFHITEEGFDDVEQTLAALPEALARTLAIIEDDEDGQDG